VRLAKNPNDVDALYARGWARALKCTYIAMVERDSGRLPSGQQAKDDEVRVLELNPNYVDAKLVAGSTSMSWARCLAFKLMIGFAGISARRRKAWRCCATTPTGA